MSDRLNELLGQIRHLEAEMMGDARKQEADYCSSMHAGKVRFADGVASRHRTFRVKLPDYWLHSRWLVWVTTPLIWACAVPIGLADAVGTIYQAICFPIYGIPKVRRADYLVFDRHHLHYLNFFEKFNCEYCAYVNGILAYFTEIAARTEQHWCPIKHAGCARCAHSRYKKFIEYGDAGEYRRKFETIRHAYGDLAGPKGTAQS